MKEKLILISCCLIITLLGCKENNPEENYLLKGKYTLEHDLSKPELYHKQNEDILDLFNSTLSLPLRVRADSLYYNGCKTPLDLIQFDSIIFTNNNQGVIVRNCNNVSHIDTFEYTRSKNIIYIKTDKYNVNGEVSISGDHLHLSMHIIWRFTGYDQDGLAKFDLIDYYPTDEFSFDNEICFLRSSPPADKETIQKIYEKYNLVNDTIAIQILLVDN